MANVGDTLYELTVEHDAGGGDYLGWSSIHISELGAKQRLHEKIIEWDLWDQYQIGEVEHSISLMVLEP